MRRGDLGPGFRSLAPHVYTFSREGCAEKRVMEAYTWQQ